MFVMGICVGNLIVPNKDGQLWGNKSERMMGKEQESIAYTVFFKNFKEYVLLRLSAKYAIDFCGDRTFVNDSLHFSDINKVVSV